MSLSKVAFDERSPGKIVVNKARQRGSSVRVAGLYSS